jgi:hypothetical protein
MTDVRFAYGKTLSGVVTRTEPWDKIARVITGKLRVYKDKADSTNAPNILGGPTDNKGKEARNVLARSLLTLDFDDLPDDFEVDDMAFSLDMLGYTALAYTTFSHRTERAGGNARLRVIVLLEDEIPCSAYPAAVRAFTEQLGIECSPESYTVAQVMFLHSAMEGFEDQAWTYVVDGVPFPVDPAWETTSGSGGRGVSRSDDDDDLLMDIAYEPLDVTWAEVDKTLELLPAEGLEYDDWLLVGMGLWHQSRGSLEADGFGRWLAWSRQSSKHDGKMMRKKWKSMGGRTNPVTMASVFARVGGLSAVRDALGHGDDGVDGAGEALGGGQEAGKVSAGGQVAKTGGLALLERFSQSAAAIDGPEDYDRLKKALQKLPESRFGSDYRAMVAEEVFSGWGKSIGLPKGEIKKALMPSRRNESSVSASGVGSGGVGDDGSMLVSEADCWDESRPAWLRGWVFDETSLEFVHVRTGHAIKHEAFRMKYARMPECGEHEMDPVGLAREIFPIPTVAGRIYWPGQGLLFQSTGNGLSYLNSWLGGGGVQAAPAGSFEVGDESIEGQACAVFLRHLELTVPDARERRLVMDWLSWVYANPGARVRWALLMWGIEGNGKSYFHRVLGRLMGRDSRTVAASTIEERFTDWAEGCRLIGIEEIRISGTNKWRTLDKMKPFISNDEIEVEGKGVKGKVVPNFASYMLFTNHIDAIPVTDGDRRYFVVFTRQREKQDLLDQHGGEQGVRDYFQTLFDVSMGGVAGIGRLLLDHQVSEEFDPNGRAPDSSGRVEMQMMHVSEEDQALQDAIERFSGPYINGQVIDVTLLQDECDFDEEIELPRGRGLSHKLTAMGYTRGRVRVRVRKKLRTYWYKPNRISAEEAERILRGDE